MSKSLNFSHIILSGFAFTVVPVEDSFIVPISCNGSLQTPCSKCIAYFLPLRFISTSKYSDKKFIPAEPIPCNPALLTCSLLPNLPPERIDENATSACDLSGYLSEGDVGKPRPLSLTVTS